VQANRDFRWLLLRLKPLRWRIGLGLLCVTVAGIAVAIDPMLTRSMIDKALPQRNLRWALELAGGIGLCFFGRSDLYLMGSLVNFSIAQHCVSDLRIVLLDQMNRLSADYHERMPTAEKLTRIEYDVDEIANVGADTANQSIRAVLFFILNLTLISDKRGVMEKACGVYRFNTANLLVELDQEKAVNPNELFSAFTAGPAKSAALPLV